MNISIKTYLLAPVLLALPHLAFAKSNFIAEHSLGLTTVSESAYESNNGYADLSIAYLTQGWIFRTGLMYLGEYESSNNGLSGKIESSAAYLSVHKIIALNAFDLEFGLGAAATHSEAKLENHNVGESDGTSPIADFSVVKDFNELISFRVGLRYINDVSGADITTVNAGLRFSF